MALDVRHGDVLDAVELADVVDAHDVLVRHLAREQELLLEAPFEHPAPRLDRAADLRMTFIATATFNSESHAWYTAPAADAEHLDDVISRSESLPDTQRTVSEAAVPGDRLAHRRAIVDGLADSGPHNRSRPERRARRQTGGIDGHAARRRARFRPTPVRIQGIGPPTGGKRGRNGGKPSSGC